MTMPGMANSGDRFIGRDRERRLIRSALERAHGGSGCAILVEGEAGIGKSRLVEEVAPDAERMGFLVLWARLLEGEAEDAYGLWGVLLRSYWKQSRRNESGAGRNTVQDENRTITEVALATKAASTDMMDGRDRLGESIVEIILEQDLPLVLIVDNLHLAGDNSLAVLRQLTSELHRFPVAVLATARNNTGRQRAELANTLAVLERSRHFLRIPLGGLSQPETAALLEDLLGGATLKDVVAAFYDRTDGNPLYTLELARFIVASGVPGDDLETAVRSLLPAGIVESVANRLAGLGPAERSVVCYAAVLGRRVDIDLVAAISETNDHSGTTPWEPLVASGLLVKTSEGEYRFTHEILRQALLSELAPAERRNLHRRAADFLEAQTQGDCAGSSRRILHHLLEAGPSVDAKRIAGRAIEAARADCAVFAPDDAVSVLEDTLSQLQSRGGESAEAKAMLAHQLALLMHDLSRPTEAVDRYVEAFEMFVAAGQIDKAIEVSISPARQLMGPVWVENALGGSGPSVLRERAISLARPGTHAHSTLLLQRGGRKDILSALEDARHRSDVGLESTALAALAYHGFLAMDLPRCLPVLEEAETAAVRSGSLFDRLACAYTRAGVSMLQGLPKKEEEALRLIFVGAREARSRLWTAAAHRLAADLALRRGDWEESRRQLTACRQFVGSGRDVVYNRTQAVQILALVEEHCGNLKAADKLWEELSRLYGKPRVRRFSFSTSLLLGDVARYPPPPAKVTVPDPEGPLVFIALGNAAGAATAAVIHRDRRTAQSCLEVLSQWSGLFIPFPSNELIGLLWAVLGRYDKAVSHLEAAVLLCSRAGYKPSEALCRFDLARCLFGTKNKANAERAVRELKSAQAIAAGLGMKLLERTARKTLRNRAADGPAPLPEHLTPREMEVLGQVACGFSNAEVARTLHISPATVARHVHNILEKTGRSNRAELSAWAGSTGLASPG